jgi:hypothetical protein
VLNGTLFTTNYNELSSTNLIARRSCDCIDSFSSLPVCYRYRTAIGY